MAGHDGGTKDHFLSLKHFQMSQTRTDTGKHVLTAVSGKIQTLRPGVTTAKFYVLAAIYLIFTL